LKKKKIQGDCFVKTWIITDQPNVLSSRTSISSVIYIYIDTHTLLHLLLVEIIESQICPNHLDLLFSCDFSTKVIRNERRRCLQADPADGPIHPPRSRGKGQRDLSFCWRSNSSLLACFCWIAWWVFQFWSYWENVFFKEFNIEKLQLVEAEKKKIRQEYERKEKQVQVRKKM